MAKTNFDYHHGGKAEEKHGEIDHQNTRPGQNGGGIHHQNAKPDANGAGNLGLPMYKGRILEKRNH